MIAAGQIFQKSIACLGEKEGSGGGYCCLFRRGSICFLFVDFYLLGHSVGQRDPRPHASEGILVQREARQYDRYRSRTRLEFFEMPTIPFPCAATIRAVACPAVLTGQLRLDPVNGGKRPEIREKSPLHRVSRPRIALSSPWMSI